MIQFRLASTASKDNWRAAAFLASFFCRVGSSHLSVTLTSCQGGNCKTVMVGTAAIEDRHLEEFWAQHPVMLHILTLRIPTGLPLAHWHIPCSGFLQIVEDLADLQTQGSITVAEVVLRGPFACGICYFYIRIGDEWKLPAPKWMVILKITSYTSISIPVTLPMPDSSGPCRRAASRRGWLPSRTTPRSMRHRIVLWVDGFVRIEWGILVIEILPTKTMDDSIKDPPKKIPSNPQENSRIMGDLKGILLWAAWFFSGNLIDFTDRLRWWRKQSADFTDQTQNDEAMAQKCGCNMVQSTKNWEYYVLCPGNSRGI